ncbi:MAG: hypothetical protein HGB12_09990, partial [Bacteroidetes bacterium]|nr:hypothetical protein [Bacteroidota bacterium]
MGTVKKLFAAIILMLAFSLTNINTFSQSWSPLGSGVDGTVNAITEYNGELYIGGLFSKAGSINSSNIAKWNGRNWAAVANGFNGSVSSLCVYKGDLYAGGNFTMSGNDSISHIAKWDGKNWKPIGKGIDGRVLSMAIYNNEIYVAGQFSKVDDIRTSNIAKWNGKIWSVVGAAIAKWENESWNVVGSGINDRVYSLCVYDSNLYAAGRFTYAGITPANCIAKWDGTSWTALNAGLSITATSEPYATAISEYNNELYITGFFNKADGITVDNITKWNGKNFLTVGTGIEYSSTGESFGRSLIVYNGELFLGGVFNNAGSIPTTNIAKWNGKIWSSVDFSKSTVISCFGIYKSSLIAGGNFKGINENPNNIASFCPYTNVDFTMTPSSGKSLPLEVKFANNINGGAKAFTYFWDFGDESNSKESNPVHIFKKYGNTPVTLYSTSPEGCSSLKIKYVTIDSLPPSKPVISENLKVLTLDNPQPNEKYQWYFNDKIIPDANSISYTANNTGSYKLIVTNSSGSSTSKPIDLVVVDNAKIASENLDINNIDARFNAEGSMFWDFVDPMFETPKGSGKST